MNKICGIYKITSPTGKIYIGQSRDINHRIAYYKNGLCKKQFKLYNSIIKYGWSSHKFEIIYECGLESLNDMERHYINIYDTFDTKNGMNLTTGGGSKINFSSESRIKMQRNAKNRKYSSETRLKISKSLTGIKRSKETLEKMKLCKTGLNHKNETKLKISDTKSSTYEIYNQNNELQYKIHGNIKKLLKRNNFPEHSFCNTYKNGTKIKRGQYKGWFIIKL